ncbi:hypothetical protein ACLOAU_04220 [Niabella sp. CJ426]|uniref:hypothetical protein n=1 Tax=Niabella sp. CJ426 TaxID=3393740 RepID=UPI003CFF0E74
MYLQQILNISGDSILEEYSYSAGMLIIVLTVGELDKKLRISINTGELHFNNFYLSKKEVLYKTCRIEIAELANILQLKNGIYTPSDSFGKFMNEARKNYNLAYGKKSSEVKYLFSLVGYSNLISCVFEDQDCIVVEEYQKN